MSNLKLATEHTINMHRNYISLFDIVSELNAKFSETFYVSHGCIFRINPASPVADLVFDRNNYYIVG